MQLLLKIIFSWQAAIVFFCLWWWLYIRMIKVKDSAKFYQQKFFELDATVKYQAHIIEQLHLDKTVMATNFADLENEKKDMWEDYHNDHVALNKANELVEFYKSAYESCAQSKKENI